MSTQLKLRRGTTAQHSTFTGASGEVTVDTDKKAIVVHDGATAGGYPQVSNQPTTRPSIRPSLLLDFANTKQLDPRVTFSRASTGAYYDGKTVVKAEENLLARSQEFDNASWLFAGVSITANSTTAPDGTSTADTITASAGASTHNIEQSASTVSGSIYAASFFVKSGTHTYVQICVSGDGTPFANFDISAGTVGTTGGSVSAAIQNAGNGWYRCSLVYTASGTAQTPIFALAPLSTATRRQSWTAAGTESIYLWGAQLEQRSTVTAYTPTTTAPITNYIPVLQTAAANVARFDHDPVTGESKGLLIEEQRTNIAQYSEQFDVSNVFGRANCFVYQVNAASPVSGFGNVFKIVMNSGTDPSVGSNNGFNLGSGNTLSNNTVYTQSVYAKAGEFSTVRLRSNSSGQLFDFPLNGTTPAATGSITSCSVTSCGNGWYRLAWTFTTTSSAPGNRADHWSIRAASTGDGYSGFYLTGAQLEAGSFATSYIPTPLTYSGRASTATYKAADGTIRTAQPNVARYESNAAGGSNLLLEGAASNQVPYSGQLDNSTLGKTRIAAVVANASVAPDGSNTAVLMIENDSSYGQHYFGYSGFSYTSGQTYTVSAYFKAKERQYAYLTFEDGVSTIGMRVTYLLSNAKTITVQNGTPVSYGMQDVGGGWYRCWLTATATSTITGSYNLIGFAYDATTIAYTGDGKSGLYIWGAQLETGSTATSYIPSVETFTGRSATVASYYDSTGIIRYAGSGVPRYTYNPSNLNAAPKLLLEPAATNILLRSSDYSATWFQASITPSYSTTDVLDPAGGNTASKLVSGGATGAIGQPVISTASAHTASIYLRTSSGTASVELIIYKASPYAGVITKTVTVTSNWTRFDVSGTFIDTTTHNFQINIAANQTVYVWGAQIETGYAPTSYIPTTSAQVTRAADTSTSAAGSRAADVYSSSQVTRSADSASMTGTNFSSWFRADEGTLYAEGSSFASGGGSYPNFAVAGADSSNIIQLGYMVSSSGGAIVKSGGTNQFETYPNTSGSNRKGTLAYKANDFATSYNGASPTLDTSGTIPVVNQLALGNYVPASSSGCINGTIKRIAYYPKRLSNAELIGITS